MEPNFESLLPAQYKYLWQEIFHFLFPSLDILFWRNNILTCRYKLTIRSKAILHLQFSSLVQISNYLDSHLLQLIALVYFLIKHVSTIGLVLNVDKGISQCTIVDHELVLNMMLRLNMSIVIHYSCPLSSQTFHETVSDWKPQTKRPNLATPLY